MSGIARLLKIQIVRYALVGGISAMIEYGLYFLFKVLMNYLIANVLAFGLTNVVTFVLSRFYVFEPSGRRKRHEAALFAICLAGAFLLNQAVLWVLVEFADVHDTIAKAAAIAVAVIWNFFTRKHVVFRNREAEAERSSSTN